MTAPAHGFVLLNVDDVEPARYAKHRTLRHAGFEVADARTGTQALQLVESLQPALVLLDVGLPDMSGIEVCRQIKQRWPGTLVLQTSATYVSTADRVQGLDVGADGYLAQPIDPAELVAAVRALLRLQAAEEATRSLNEQLEQRIGERTRELLDANVALLGQIAQRERAEAALAHSQKMEAVGQLTGAVAHDFNNVLGSVTGYLHVLKLKSGDPDVRELVDKALGAAGRGAKLTQRLLAFSRSQRLHTEAVDVSALLADMRDWLSQAVGSAVQVEVRPAPTRLVAMTDGNQLELALLNLALNARDAMPHGGRIVVEARAQTIDADEGDLARGDYVAISVRDDGTGMEPDVVARAFDPFYTTKPVGLGTGLGLAQVSTLARQSKGAARIASTPGKGTTVTLWLGAASGDAALPRPLDVGADGGTDASILVVDDDDDMRALVSGLLSDAGYRVSVAKDGADALQQLRTERPDMLMLDYSMPGLTGGEVAVHARLAHPGLPVLFVSGHADIDAFAEAAADAMRLRKPFRPAELLSAVKRCVAAGRAPQ